MTDSLYSGFATLVSLGTPTIGRQKYAALILIPFSRQTTTGGIVCWRGASCDDVHAHVLELLNADFGGAFINSASELTNQLRGNLSEFVCLRIGQGHDHSALRLLSPPNAFTPLSRVSRSGVDLMWLHFGADAADDFALLQEVKATIQPGLSYASALPVDYEKLFGSDLNLTLQTRLLAAKNEVEYVLERPDLVPRVAALGSDRPQKCTKIRLVPTLVHDESAPSPEAKLEVVRQTIVGLGWAADSVTAWSVALDEFDSRLARLAMGEP